MPDANDVAGALAAALRELVALSPPCWWTEHDAALAVVTGIPAAPNNGVVAHGLDVDPAMVELALDEVAATGLPHSLQVRPGMVGTAAAVAERRAMRRGDDVPLMAVPDIDAVAAPEMPRELSIRTLGPDEAGVHAEVAGAGFGAPVEFFLPLLTPQVMAEEGIRVYVGELAGEPVVTAIGTTRDGNVGIHNVTTLPSHRRRGYGAALTAHAVTAARAHGARWAWLQSSPNAVPVYEALGFRTLERWAYWETASG
jgi:GNAT superfamily N-acetyltransferase